MPIKSFLAYPEKGDKNILLQSLSSLSNCEVIPAENEDVIIVVTDTSDIEKEKELITQIESIKSLKFLTMVSGYETSSEKQ